MSSPEDKKSLAINQSFCGITMKMALSEYSNITKQHVYIRESAYEGSLYKIYTLRSHLRVRFIVIYSPKAVEITIILRGSYRVVNGFQVLDLDDSSTCGIVETCITHL